MNLLTVVIPKLKEWARKGRKEEKLAQLTRYGTVVIALIQAFGMSFTIARQAVVEETFTAYLVIIISLTAGTAFLMWMGN